MRKNVKQQLALRVLSTAALMAMVSSIATAAFADTYDLNTGSVTVETKEDGFTYVTQLDNTQKDGYARNDKDDILHDYQDKTGVTITSYGQQTSNTITVETAKDQTTDVTLEDVFINREGAWSSDSEAALTVKGDGNTNIELNGNNTLSSTGAHAGLEKTDAECSGTLTITDDKNDDGSEKEKDKYGYSTGGNTGTLAVVGGGSGGAGIGGQGRIESDSRAQEIHDASNITITGGNISAGRTPEGCNYNAHWNPGAGIGGGSHGGDGTNITITGNANVDAYGSYYAAGIGGSDYFLEEGEDGKSYTKGGDGENITISGNAKVTARGWDAAGIGGAEYGAGKNIQIKDNADVHAYAGPNGAGIGGGRGCGGEVSISGNATVFAQGDNGGAGIGSGDHNCNDVAPERRDTTVTISDNATVTAIGSFNSAGIGNGNDQRNLGKTDITITGGTITAIGGVITKDGRIFGGCGIGGGEDYEDGSPAQNVTVTINGTTGNTTVNASCAQDVESAISKGNDTADIIGYDADGVSPFGEEHSVVVRMYKKGSITLSDFDRNTHRYNSVNYNPGELYQTVHNRKYMEEHPEEIVDINKLKDEDLHDWKLVGRVVEPTLEKGGYADYVCGIDKCGQTKRVVLPKLTPEPSEPDTTDPDVPGGNTPDTPNKPDTPKQPDGTTPAPVTPDAPVQDSTAPADTLAADTTADAAAVPADAAVAPAAAQNVVQDAKPEAAATAAVSAAALPQTGANWLAVVGSALSGMFLLAAGFVLNRKNRRMN
mgnify:CR=1 FL=1